MLCNTNISIEVHGDHSLKFKFKLYLNSNGHSRILSYKKTFI